MKNNQGFMLIETAVIFLLVLALLSCVVYGYGMCLRTQERSREAWQAFLLAERFALGQEVVAPAGWRIAEEKAMVQNIPILEVQVLSGERVVANVVQVL